MDMRGVLIGGLAPALLYGLAGVLQKASQRAGAGVGPYLLCIGGGVLAAGVVATLTGGDRAITGRGAAFAAAMGLLWAFGTWLVAIAIARYDVPVAKLAPLYNLNTVVVVLLGLVLFLEHRDVSVARLAVGVALVLAGATVVARA